MIIRILILLFVVSVSNIVLANDKQFLIPGYGFVDQKAEDEQWLIPGYGFIDEETGAAPPAGGEFNQAIIISKMEDFSDDIETLFPVSVGDIILLTRWYHGCGNH